MTSNKDKLGYFLITIVVLILIAFFGFKLSQDKKPKAGANNCVGQPSASTVILIDHSEQISDQTRDEISSRALVFIRDKVSTNDLVTIFLVSDISKRSLRPLVSLCKPPDDGNRLVESTKIIQKRFIDNFDKPIRHALSMGHDNATESPIAQAITDISLTQYLRSGRNNLLIFSDMLENTDKFSMYKCGSASNVISNYRESRRGAQERPYFKNTNVELHMIPRLKTSKEMLKCRDKLWAWFFGDNDGNNSGFSIEYLPGGAPQVLN